MFRSVRKAFYIIDFIAFLTLYLLAIMAFLVFIYDEGFSLPTIEFLIVVIIMTPLIIHYLYNLLLDEKIRRYGKRLLHL